MAKITQEPLRIAWKNPKNRSLFYVYHNPLEIKKKRPFKKIKVNENKALK